MLYNYLKKLVSNQRMMAVLPHCIFQHFSGLEEAVYRNIDACKELSQTTKSAYGPHGKTKHAKQ
jgi:hypothetical protein